MSLVVTSFCTNSVDTTTILAAMLDHRYTSELRAAIISRLHIAPACVSTAHALRGVQQRFCDQHPATCSLVLLRT